MKAPSKEEIKEHLKLHKREFPRIQIAKAIDVSVSRLNNCLSKETMPESMAYEIAKFTGMITKEVGQVIPDNLITVKVPHKNWGKWEQAALSENKTVSDWLLAAGNKDAEQLLAKHFPDILPMVAEDEAKYTTSEDNVIDPSIEEKGNGGEAEQPPA